MQTQQSNMNSLLTQLALTNTSLKTQINNIRKELEELDQFFLEQKKLAQQESDIEL